MCRHVQARKLRIQVLWLVDFRAVQTCATCSMFLSPGSPHTMFLTTFILENRGEWRWKEEDFTENIWLFVSHHTFVQRLVLTQQVRWDCVTEAGGCKKGFDITPALTRSRRRNHAFLSSLSGVCPVVSLPDDHAFAITILLISRGKPRITSPFLVGLFESLGDIYTK